MKFAGMILGGVNLMHRVVRVCFEFREELVWEFGIRAWFF